MIFLYFVGVVVTVDDAIIEKKVKEMRDQIAHCIIPKTTNKQNMWGA